MSDAGQLYSMGFRFPSFHISLSVRNWSPSSSSPSPNIFDCLDIGQSTHLFFRMIEVINWTNQCHFRWVRVDAVWVLFISLENAQD